MSSSRHSEDKYESGITAAWDVWESIPDDSASFDAWQRSRQLTYDMRRVTGFDDVKSPGFIYKGCYWVLIMDDGRFYTQSGSREYLEIDLTYIERKLWEEYGAS